MTRVCKLHTGVSTSGAVDHRPDANFVYSRVGVCSTAAVGRHVDIFRSTVDESNLVEIMINSSICKEFLISNEPWSAPNRPRGYQ